jgi:hypothetical protein
MGGRAIELVRERDQGAALLPAPQREWVRIGLHHASIARAYFIASEISLLVN